MVGFHSGLFFAHPFNFLPLLSSTRYKLVFCSHAVVYFDAIFFSLRFLLIFKTWNRNLNCQRISASHTRKSNPLNMTIEELTNEEFQKKIRKIYQFYAGPQNYIEIRTFQKFLSFFSEIIFRWWIIWMVNQYLFIILSRPFWCLN